MLRKEEEEEEEEREASDYGRALAGLRAQVLCGRNIPSPPSCREHCVRGGALCDSGYAVGPRLRANDPVRWRRTDTRLYHRVGIHRCLDLRISAVCVIDALSICGVVRQVVARACSGATRSGASDRRCCAGSCGERDERRRWRWRRRERRCIARRFE